MPEPYILSNITVCLLLATAFGVVSAVRKSDLWLEASRELWRRRPIALLVFGLYLLIGLLDSIAWVGGSVTGEDAVAVYKPKSIVDRLFVNLEEKSYSAPLADREFYDRSPLRHQGSHLLGTDILGRDVLYLTLKGARVALLIGILTSLIAIPLAVLLGVAAGYFGKRTDDIIFFLLSTLASMPGLLLLIALIIVLGRGTLSVCIALGVTSWVGFCRITRGETMKLRELDYVYAARVLGVSETRIIARHVLPGLVHLIVITFVLTFSGLVLTEAVLSWLGVGVDGSWGQMIAQAKDEISREPVIWWNITSAGVALFVLLLVLNFVGDAIRDILDPRTLRENL
ncbi:MAG: ABC transporter permease [Deltaproteobacteria bacterium]|nr:ABC transporter permease [Deltaproteobacteria bacterium]